MKLKAAFVNEKKELWIIMESVKEAVQMACLEDADECFLMSLRQNKVFNNEQNNDFLII